MFNYLEIADNLIDTVIEDINDTKYKHDTPKQISHPNPKPEEIEYWILLNQKKLFNETAITSNHIETLLFCAYMDQNFNGKDDYNNGNLDIIPLDVMLKTTHMKSILNFINNLELLSNHFETYFVLHDYNTWVNRILHIFYNDLPIDKVKDTFQPVSIKEKFELTDDDAKLLMQLKK